MTLAFEGAPWSNFKVPGHDSRLGQVVSNLVDNARSFSPAGGNVRITCRKLKNEVEIVVDDDGPGIRPDALDKIFERFYTDRPEQGFGQNSGLGLSICKQIVEAHGGTIRVENRTAPRRPPGEEKTRACSARASSCACRRCDGCVGRAANSLHLPLAGEVGRVARREGVTAYVSTSTPPPANPPPQGGGMQRANARHNPTIHASAVLVGPKRC